MKDHINNVWIRLQKTNYCDRQTVNCIKKTCDFVKYFSGKRVAELECTRRQQFLHHCKFLTKRETSIYLT